MSDDKLGTMNSIPISSAYGEADHSNEVGQEPKRESFAILVSGFYNTIMTSSVHLM